MATQVVSEIQTEAGPSAPFFTTAEQMRKPTIYTTIELQAISHDSLSVAPAWSHPRSGASQPGSAASTTEFPKARSIVVIVQLLGLQLFSSFCNGIIVVGLPSIASTLELNDSLLIWPTSAFYLTAGSCLLLAGSIADVVGVKRVNLVGSFLLAITALACGLARNGSQIIAFRALQGISYAIVTPSSTSIISTSIEEGRPRNIGFACLGLAGPLGFSLGLVLSGIMISTVGWRPAFYLATAASTSLFVIGIWAIPWDQPQRPGRSTWKRLVAEIDWTGMLLASAGLAMLSYVLA